MKRGHSSRTIDAILVVALAAAAFLLFRKILRLWWMYDDAFLIRILQAVSLQTMLHDRAFYSQLGRPIFNPLLMVSWKLDLQQFGLNTKALYLHQLIAFALLAMFLYLLFRLWSSPIASAAAAVVFTISGPTLVVVPQLMLRHYVEGALFATVAVILFVMALRRSSWSLALVSALLYFCASAAKEVYAPLILILIAIPEGSIKQRLRFAIPHAVAALAIAVWRVLVIGRSVAPFGFLPPPGKRAVAILTIPVRAIRQFAGTGTAPGWMLLALVIVCAVIVAIRIRGARLVAACGLIAVVAPLLPVAGEMQPRWAFAPWLIATASIAFLPIALPRTGNVLSIVAVLLALLAYRAEWPAAYRLFLRMSDEARVLAKLTSQDVLRNPATPPAAVAEIGRLTGSHARAFYDDLPLCNSGQNFRIFEYDSAKREVVQTARSTILQSCRSIRLMPLTLRLHYEPDGAFYWNAGPYRDGTYAFIVGEGIAYDVPPQAGFRGKGLQRFDFRVRYSSPAGWKTYSPVLAADARKGTIIFQQ
jgi:hypothetical protein